MSDAVLKAEGIKKSYSGLLILKGLSFSIEKGTTCSIVGKSGSGKTTLLNVLSLLDTKDEGKIYYKGKDTDEMREKELVELRKKSLGFVFQNSLLLEDFSALENVELSLIISGRGKKEARKEAEAVLERVGLKDRIHHRPKELSGGERQRVAISRAISSSSDLVFLDEPTGSLDESAKESVESLLFSSSLLYDKAVIIVTHDKDLSMKTNERYELKGGKLEKLFS